MHECPLGHLCNKAVLTPLLNDIAKIVYYDLNIGYDQQNLVVIQTNNSNYPNYVIRYFGFDFSAKPSEKRIQDRDPIRDFGKNQLGYLEGLFDDFLRLIVDREFPDKPLRESTLPEESREGKNEENDIIKFNREQIGKYYQLKEKLFQEYKGYIEDEVKQLIKINKSSL